MAFLVPLVGWRTESPLTFRRTRPAILRDQAVWIHTDVAPNR